MIEETLREAIALLDPDRLQRRIDALEARRRELWKRYNRLCEEKHNLEGRLEEAKTQEARDVKKLFEIQLKALEDA